MFLTASEKERLKSMAGFDPIISSISDQKFKATVLLYLDDISEKLSVLNSSGNKFNIHKNKN